MCRQKKIHNNPPPPFSSNKPFLRGAFFPASMLLIVIASEISQKYGFCRSFRYSYRLLMILMQKTIFFRTQIPTFREFTPKWLNDFLMNLNRLPKSINNFSEVAHPPPNQPLFELMFFWYIRTRFYGIFDRVSICMATHYRF